MPEKGGGGGGGERARLAEEVLGGETPKTCGACLQRSLADASDDLLAGWVEPSVG